MATTLKTMMDRLPTERRERVESRAAELVAEELTLRDLRKARDLGFSLAECEELLELISDSDHMNRDNIARRRRIDTVKQSGDGASRVGAMRGLTPVMQPTRFVQRPLQARIADIDQQVHVQRLPVSPNRNETSPETSRCVPPAASSTSLPSASIPRAVPDSVRLPTCTTTGRSASTS